MRFGRRHSLSLLGLFLVLLFFTNLGSYGLLEDNEARFFEISWEMKRSQDLVVPRLNFISHFHKPPATFWLVASSLQILGETEIAGRVPMAICALVTVFLTTLFVQDRAHREAVALVLACNAQYWLLARTVLTDGPLTLCVTLCMLSAWRCDQGHSGLAPRLLFWISLGASALVKGPVGLAIVGLAMLSYARWSGREIWASLYPKQGISLALAVMLPWYTIVCLRYPQLFGYLAGFHTIQRLTSEVHGRGGPLWFYLPVILVGFFPWSLLLPGALREALHRRADFDKYLLCWLLPALGFFTLAGSKLPTYLLPLFPPLALLVSRHLLSADAATSGLLSRRVHASLFLFGISVILFVFAGLPSELAPAQWILLVAAVVCIATSTTSVLGVLLLRRGSPSLSHRWAAIGFGLVLVTLSFGLKPCEGRYSARRLAERLKPMLGPSTVLAEFGHHHYALPYYLERRIGEVLIHRETQFEKTGSTDNYLFKDLTEFEHKFPNRHKVLVLKAEDYKPEDFAAWTPVYKDRWMILESDKL